SSSRAIGSSSCVRRRRPLRERWLSEPDDDGRRVGRCASSEHIAEPVARSFHVSINQKREDLGRESVAEIEYTHIGPGEAIEMRAKLTAEFLGTFWLVFGGCGSAVLAAAFPELGIGFAGVALAFGLTVLTGAYALGPLSGAHFNPAVSVGLWAGGRFPASGLLPY